MSGVSALLCLQQNTTKQKQLLGKANCSCRTVEADAQPAALQLHPEQFIQCHECLAANRTANAREGTPTVSWNVTKTLCSWGTFR